MQTLFMIYSNIMMPTLRYNFICGELKLLVGKSKLPTRKYSNQILYLNSI